MESEDDLALLYGASVSCRKKKAEPLYRRIKLSQGKAVKYHPRA